MATMATTPSIRTAVSARFRWREYAPLALLRVGAAVFALAMIHPDEFFQSQEIMAREVLRDSDPMLASQLHAPWEFSLPSPNRSVLFPYLVAGLPYKLLQWLRVPLSGHVLLLVPRLLLCALSFLIDASLFHCAKAIRMQNPTAVVLSFASSWPVLIFLTRPFSNTVETLLLALAMVTLLCFDAHRRILFQTLHVQTLLLGSLLAVGVFTRFTFPFFFFPLGLELVRRQDELLVQQFEKKHESWTESVVTKSTSVTKHEGTRAKPEVTKSSSVSKLTRFVEQFEKTNDVGTATNGANHRAAVKTDMAAKASVSKLSQFVQQFDNKPVSAVGKRSLSMPRVSRLVQQHETENEVVVAETNVTKSASESKLPGLPSEQPAAKEPWDYTKTTSAMDVAIRTTQATALTQRRIARAFSIGLQGFVSFAFWSVAIVALDTWYFLGEVPLTVETWTNTIVAPWNNFKYNLDPANLALHGMHSRFTHALVNMPMMFGPLFIVFLVQLKTARRRLWQISCVLVPLLLISLAPHQEPRFLLPLLVPLHLFHGGCLVDARWKQVLWVIFSTVLALFFGVLHQGGLLPLLLALGSGGSSSALLTLPFTGCRLVGDMPTLNNMPIVFYKTYMPPRFVLANADEPWGYNFRVVDLAGGDAMETQVHEHSLASFSELLLIAPASVEIENVVATLGTTASDPKPTVVGTCFPHVSTENLDWDKPLELVIYRWTKPSLVARLWEATAAVFSS